jgi:hypothetical protein
MINEISFIKDPKYASEIIYHSKQIKRYKESESIDLYEIILDSYHNISYKDRKGKIISYPIPDKIKIFIYKSYLKIEFDLGDRLKSIQIVKSIQYQTEIINILKILTL